MITTDEGLRLSLDQLRDVYQALAASRSEHPNASPEWRAVLSEGLIDHARQLQREIDAYTGVSATAASQADDRLEDHVGDLREIDLDNRTMTLRNVEDVPEVRCALDEAILDLAKRSLDHRVKVFGVWKRQPGKKAPLLHVSRIEVFEDSTTR